METLRAEIPVELVAAAGLDAGNLSSPSTNGSGFQLRRIAK